MRPSGQWALGEAQPLSGSDAMVISAVGNETPTVPLAGGAIPTDSSSRLAPQPPPMNHDFHELDNHGTPTGFYVCSNLNCALSLAWPEPWVWHEDLPVESECPQPPHHETT